LGQDEVVEEEDREMPGDGAPCGQMEAADRAVDRRAAEATADEGRQERANRKSTEYRKRVASRERGQCCWMWSKA